VTTWRFWRALKNPPSEDPLFKRIVASYTPPRRRRLFAGGLILLVAFEFSLGLLSALAPALQGVALILSLIPPGLLLAMTFNSTPYATTWAATISGAIARERELRRYDLLCALPPGVMGTCMTICARCLSRDQTFKNLPRLEGLPAGQSHQKSR